MKKSLIILIFILFPIFQFAQYFSSNGEWKIFRKELFFTGGASNFLGDLGGRDKTGTDFSPVDLEFGLTKSAFGIGYRYKLQRWCNITSKFNYLIVKGDDALTKDIYRNNRNLNFKSNIFELSGRIEMGWETKKLGNRYGIKNTLNRRMKNNKHGVFLFAGIGGFYFNPKGFNSKGTYVRLKSLHTEGQGLPGAPKQYKNFSVCIPLGIYYKATIQKKWTVGLEISWRKTFTDYIDDVSTKYYDNNTIASAYGTLAAEMADPSLGNIYGATLPAADGVGAQRGDKENDSYMSVELTVGYIFKKKHKRARLKTKF